MHSLSDTDIVLLTEWLHALEEGTLEESQRARFEAMLAQKEAARRFYVQRMSLGAALCKLADEAQEAEGPEADASSRVIPLPQGRRKWPVSAKLALAATLVLCGIILTMEWKERPGNVEETSDAGCAVLMDAAGAQWATGSRAWQCGMSVPAGKLALE